tara:strand:- start:583 stop:1545 length:963 start_codon:yes stop_codon:yes gene_type:complete
MKKIAFYQPHLDIQGTGVSNYDYAHFNQVILGNKSYMICDKGHKGTHPLAMQKFKNSMEVIELDGSQDMAALENVLQKIKADAVYIQKCGKKDDGRLVKNIPMLTHVVGCENDPHGSVYAYVSEWLSSHSSNGEHPFVPYIVHLPEHSEDYRDALKIPSSATVFSRLGGFYGWDIPFVNSAIIKLLSLREDVYFVFAQTPPFISHDRVIFVEPFADLDTKRKFINTADAMIHARTIGESFGMACAEYSFCNKPVITFKNSPERNHISTLGEKGIYYEDEETVLEIMKSFEKKPNEDWNAYANFTPEKVMQKFNEVFLSKI